MVPLFHSISLGQSLDLDFFCKTRGSDNVIAKAFCSFLGLNISHIKDKDQIMYSFFFLLNHKRPRSRAVILSPRRSSPPGDIGQHLEAIFGCPDRSEQGLLLLSGVQRVGVMLSTL